jgi:SAM-dependent methyltransferase
MLTADPKQRFSNRVDDYVRYRPGYPSAILDLLRDDCGLAPDSAVADIGSGTGLLARLFLASGNVVFGVEPNREMRQAGEQVLQEFRRFRSVAGSAEATTLPAASVDFVVAGQSFHWFEPAGARAEFQRILRPGGWVAVIWNERKMDSTPFLRAYAKLIREYGTDYEGVAATYQEYERSEQFFGPGAVRKKSFPNEQTFDWDGLRGRLLSSSYAPQPGHPNHEPMIAALAKIFEEHNENGRVRFEYDARIFYGHLAPGRLMGTSEGNFTKP